MQEKLIARPRFYANDSNPPPFLARKVAPALLAFGMCDLPCVSESDPESLPSSFSSSSLSSGISIGCSLIAGVEGTGFGDKMSCENMAWLAISESFRYFGTMDDVIWAIVFDLIGASLSESDSVGEFSV